MFLFELRLVNAKTKLGAVTVNEFQLATLLRILKSRNKDLYNRLNKYYDDITHELTYQDLPAMKVRRRR
jgi:hypothetical protein